MRALLLLLVWLPHPVLACTEAPDPARFTVHHGAFGEIGWHEITFACEGERLIAETRAEIGVEVLFVEAFRRTVHYVEAWRDDRLVEFYGRTVDNGRERVVRAHLDGGRLAIEGPAGATDAPAETIPSHPWHPASGTDRPLFDVATGEVVEVEVRDLGEEWLKIDGEPVRARHVVTTRGKRRELWYDASGRFLQWRLQRQGTVTLLRTSL